MRSALQRAASLMIVSIDPSCASLCSSNCRSSSYSFLVSSSSRLRASSLSIPFSSFSSRSFSLSSSPPLPSFPRLHTFTSSCFSSFSTVVSPLSTSRASNSPTFVGPSKEKRTRARSSDSRASRIQTARTTPHLTTQRSGTNGMAGPGPWSSIRRALRATLHGRRAVVALGASAAGATVWASLNSQWRPGFFASHSQLSRGGPSCGNGKEKRVQMKGKGYSSSDGASGVASSSSTELVLLSGACMIPHPDKADRGGEDAYFTCEKSLCMGVADGVGGWAEVGVDPGLYSRELMERAKTLTQQLRRGPEAPQEALEAAHATTQARGSSTACIVCLYDAQLHASNLGDSGFMVVRQGEVAFMSPQQQHEFNFPYQIGSPDSMGDLPQAAQRFVIEVQAGDIVVAATDGVFDNVYPDEAAAVVAAAKEKGDSPATAATALAQFARTRAEDDTYLSPFAYGAQQLGFRYFGGKLDDITVVCAYIEGPGSVMDKDTTLRRGDSATNDSDGTSSARKLPMSEGSPESSVPKSRL